MYGFLIRRIVFSILPRSCFLIAYGPLETLSFTCFLVLWLDSNTSILFVRFTDAEEFALWTSEIDRIELLSEVHTKLKDMFSESITFRIFQVTLQDRLGISDEKNMRRGSSFKFVDFLPLLSFRF